MLLLPQYTFVVLLFGLLFVPNSSRRYLGSFPCGFATVRRPLSGYGPPGLEGLELSAPRFHGAHPVARAASGLPYCVILHV